MEQLKKVSVSSSWPVMEQEEIDIAVRTLRSGKINYWTGKEGHLFEKDFAEYIGRKHAVAVANGSVALELALKALGVGDGDEVIVGARSFVASASSVVLQKAKPVFADVDRNNQNISRKTIEPLISQKTKALIATHLGGWPCDMDEIKELAANNNIKIIEDCAQSHGACYKEKITGSFGDIAAFSFCQDKIITSGGEGGMVLTDDETIWKKMWAYKDHGKNYDTLYHKKHKPGFRWLHESFGTNLRMTEVQSAIGRVGLKKIGHWLEIRRKNAAILHERFSKLPELRVTIPPPHIKHAYYKYYVFLHQEILRDKIMKEIIDRGIPCFTGICSEIYLEKSFAKAGLQPKKRLPIAKELGETSLMFLVDPTLSVDDMHTTADIVESVLKKFAR